MSKQDEVKPGVGRRQLLQGALAGAAGAATMVAMPALAAGVSFAHGVASGDPLADAVIIWTRVSNLTRSASVRWSVALDEAFTQVVKRGSAVASAARDYTIKIDVKGLRSATRYFYRFEADNGMSPVGRTRTLPTGSVARVKLVVFSCTAFENGFFNAYREATTIADLDAVLHLGDYLYEYARTDSGLGGQRPRLGQIDPVNEIVSLADYRARHGTYKRDADLQELHRLNPWITVWDDHEVTNDGWREGAQNHQPATEGDWDERKRVAIQAYYEWMPIREPSERPRIDANGDPQGMYRDFDFGNLVRLIMLDSRLAGRDEQLDPVTLSAVYGGTRSDTLDGTAATRARQLLNPIQIAYVQGRIVTSSQTWQLFGNQTLFHLQTAPDIVNSPVFNGPLEPLRAALIAGLSSLFGAAFVAQLLAFAPFGVPNPVAADSWTGYSTARAQFLGLMTLATNPVVLTGDSHNAWTAQLNVPTGLPKPNNLAPVGVEFGGTSVTSPGSEGVLGGFPATLFAALLSESSQRVSPTDKLIYTEQARRGFLVVDVTPTELVAEHVFVSTTQTTSYTVERKRFRVAAGSRTVQAV